MAGFSYSNNEHLVRSNVWSSQLKEAFQDELFATRYIDMITDFGDGDTLNIPSIGVAEVADYLEGQAVKYTAMDTGNFTFTITAYKSSATYITERMKQDSFYMSRLVAAFIPKQRRALMKALEVDALAVGPNGQTASNPNAINGADHRRIGLGTSEQIAVKDFALAKYALRVANAPMTNLVAIVDPSVEYTLKTLSTITDLSNNKMWEGIVRDDLSTGMRFSMNVYGFDVYVSDNLRKNIAETITATVGGARTTTVGVANLFFSAAPDVLPFVGAMRQEPKVDSEYNKDYQREEYVSTMRYGLKLYRPENLVTIITDTDQVG